MNAVGRNWGIRRKIFRTASSAKEKGFYMKKFLCSALVCALLCALPLSSNAYDQMFFECENGVITGAAVLKDNNNIQDMGDFASGGAIVGMSGDDSDPTLATTITFENIAFPEDGTYRITLRFDTTSDTHKGVDLLVDDTRYEFFIDEANLPESWATQMNQSYIDAVILAGEHDIALTTPLDFNRDSTNPETYVKSVNADYITIDFLEPLPAAEEAPAEQKGMIEEAAKAEESAPAAVTAPQTFDASAILGISALLSGASAYLVSKKKH